MEMPSQGWHDPYQREGLSICQVHRVRLFVSVMQGLTLTPRSEFEW